MTKLSIAFGLGVAVGGLAGSFFALLLFCYFIQ